MLAVTNNLDAKMSRRMLFPLDVVDLAQILLSRVKQIDIVGDDQSIIHVNMDMHKWSTIPTLIEGISHLSGVEPNWSKLCLQGGILVMMCLLWTVDWLVQQDNVLALILETTNLNRVDRDVHGTHEKSFDDFKGLELWSSRSSDTARAWIVLRNSLTPKDA